MTHYHDEDENELGAARSTAPEAGKAVDIAQLLTNCAQIIDVVKGEWSKEGAWSEWDQSVRDDISKALSALASVPAPSGAEPVAAKIVAYIDRAGLSRLAVGDHVTVWASPFHMLDGHAAIPLSVAPPSAALAPQAVPAEDVAGLVERLHRDAARLREEATLDDNASRTSNNPDAAPMFASWAIDKRRRADDIESLTAALTSLSAERDDLDRCLNEEQMQTTVGGEIITDLKAKLAASEAEATSLRAIISECAKALGNGAYIAPTCTVEFMSNLPEEIRLVVADLRRKLEEAIDECADVARKHLAGYDDGDDGFGVETAILALKRRLLP